MIIKMTSYDAIEYLIANYGFTTVLDVGCGVGEHSDIFKDAGKSVTSVALNNAYAGATVCDYMDLDAHEPFDCVWCSHVLEHQRNAGLFLEKLYRDTSDILAITVPPIRHELRDDHVSFWNLGLLLYNLVLTGWDCTDAKVKEYQYNVSVIVRKKKERLHVKNLKEAVGYFPTKCNHVLPRPSSKEW